MRANKLYIFHFLNSHSIACNSFCKHGFMCIFPAHLSRIRLNIIKIKYTLRTICSLRVSLAITLCHCYCSLSDFVGCDAGLLVADTKYQKATSLILVVCTWLKNGSVVLLMLGRIVHIICRFQCI